MDREALADFLRHRRGALLPEDVGLATTARRRTPGLRREEVALLASMSNDYYTRLEQGRGPQPSPPILAAIARALRLSLTERDHLFRLAGQTPPSRDVRSDYVSPGLQRVLDRLDTPAMVTNDLGEVLAQNPLGVALFGDESRIPRGDLRRSRFFRWFTEPAERSRHAEEEHDRLSRAYVAALRLAAARHPDDPRGEQVVAALRAASPDFSTLWDRHDVSWRAGSDTKHFIHPQVGRLELGCDVLSADSESQILLVYTATPGSETAERLRLLAVIGAQEFGEPVGATPAGPTR